MGRDKYHESGLQYKKIKEKVGPGKKITGIIKADGYGTRLCACGHRT